MSQIREAVTRLGGIVQTAAVLTAAGTPVCKSTVGRWCIEGRVFALAHAVALADLVHPDPRDAAERLHFLREIKGRAA